MDKRKISLLLSAFLLTAIISTACADEKVAITDTISDTTAEDTSVETNEYNASNVLDIYENIDYGGYDLTILTSNYINSSLPARTAPDDTLTGDIVNDALFNRDLAVEQKYNINIGYMLAPYDGPDIVNLAKKIDYSW